MAEPERVQFPRRAVVAFRALIVVTLFLATSHVWLEPVGTDVTHREIRISALWPVMFWSLSWLIALKRTRSNDIVAFMWAFGCVLLLIHIAAAFHLGHGWSHEAAWEHTREISGYGDGIFVNYAFALIWLADAIWVWISFRSYLARPRWLHWSIHGFIAFVVFNAAVVFGSLQSRIAFAVGLLFSVVAAAEMWWRGRRTGLDHN